MTYAAPRATDSPRLRVRHRVLAYLCALSMITYLDRVCFGAAAPILASELSLAGVEELKWAFTAFAIAYAIFEVPSAWLGDTLGPRGTLVRIVVWWSSFTALTGLIGLRVGSLVLGGVGTLAALRFLFGAGEAGAYPNITRALHNWFPLHERTTAQGCIWMSGRLMGGLTPLIWTLLVLGTNWTPALVGWRGAFLLLGVVGLLWCLGFARVFHNHPTEDPRVSDAELAEITTAQDASAAAPPAVPWRSFLASRNLWLLCLMYLCVNYGWYFNITYLPSYLLARFEAPGQSLLVAVYQGAPLWLGAVGCLLGGVLADALIRRTGDRRLIRRRLGVGNLLGCAACWLLAIVAPNMHLFCLAVAGAALLNDMTLASAWATCQDVGRQYAAVTAACMNTIGTLGAALAGWLTGAIVEHVLTARTEQLGANVLQMPSAAQTAGYDIAFATYAGAYVVAAICWRFIDPNRPIVPLATPQIQLPPSSNTA